MSFYLQIEPRKEIWTLSSIDGQLLKDSETQQILGLNDSL